MENHVFLVELFEFERNGLYIFDFMANFFTCWKILISGGMEMENDADSVALMSMYTEIRRKAGYRILLHFLFLIHENNGIVKQVLWLLQNSFSNFKGCSFSINCIDSYFVIFVRSVHLKCWTMVYVTSKHCFVCCICGYIHIYFQWHQSTHANYHRLELLVIT